MKAARFVLAALALMVVSACSSADISGPSDQAEQGGHGSGIGELRGGHGSGIGQLNGGHGSGIG